RFEGLPKGHDGRELGPQELSAYWGNVEIPYRPYYAYEETLATVGDESGIANSLLSAFERLTAVITDREVTSLPPLPESVRLRCRDAYLRRRPPASSSPTPRRTAPGPTGSAICCAGRAATSPCTTSRPVP
ncbi:hypothetical protein, partial [Streptomyces pseudogriseolus]|uniref:hypothetical protein n=1 Tax=Streptomyces pseudogriseolus TaxID=36817 RepID=UPI003F9F0D9A